MSEEKRSAPDAPSAGAPAEKPRPQTQPAKVVALPRRAPEAKRPEVTVLVVDGDGVSRRFVELIVSREPGWTVESAKEGAAALEIVGTTPVDVVISERDLPDMSGVELFQRLQSQGRLRNMSFIFLTSDDRVATRVMAFRLGVDDLLVKPCDAGELMARVAARARRARKALDEARRRSYSLAGDLSVMELPDLVSTFEMQRHTGLLAVTTSRAGAELFIEDGDLVHARYGNLVGPEAFYRLMRDTDGHFEFTPGPLELGPSERTIAASVTELVMEGARLQDTAAQYAQADTLGPEPGTDPDLTSAFAALKRAPPSAQLAVQFEQSVGDAFKIGELRLLTAETMREWTAQPGGKDRLHLHLVADLAAGVAAMMPLASPQTEREVLAALTPSAKALSLSFFLRGDRLLDVLLVDISAPDALERGMARAPGVVFIAPPQGDFLGVGIRARVGLERLLERMMPPVVLGVGNAALQGHLLGLKPLQERAHVVHCNPGLLGEHTTDLRALLVQGIQLWGHAAAG